MKFFKGFKLSYLAPEAPAIAEFSTGEVMGHSSDRLAATWGVTREEQDDFAFRSHQNAFKAHKAGLLKDEITPGPDGNTMDNGIKGDAPREKYSTLKPAFVKPHGTHTAANSSFLSDGASAALLMSEQHALANGWAPKARLVDWIFVSQVCMMIPYLMARLVDWIFVSQVCMMILYCIARLVDWIFVSQVRRRARTPVCAYTLASIDTHSYLLTPAHKAPATVYPHE